MGVLKATPENEKKPSFRRFFPVLHYFRNHKADCHGQQDIDHRWIQVLVAENEGDCQYIKCSLCDFCI